MPMRLTDYNDPEWLKHYSLGELYRHGDVRSPEEQFGSSLPHAPTVSAS